MSARFRLWENRWTGTVLLIRLEDLSVNTVPVRSFSSLVAAQNWCADNGVMLQGCAS